VSGRAAAVREAVAARPRHLALFCLVAGLGLGPLAAPAVALAALVPVALVRRAGLGLLGAAFVLGGAVLADARLAALDGGAAPALVGQRVQGRAVVLEPLRRRRDGTLAGRARLLDGPARGEQVVLRVRRAGGEEDARPSPVPVGHVVAVRGRIARLGEFERHQRRRGASVALETAQLRATGARRGGLAGDLDAVRGRAERGLERGLGEGEAALLLGMVLGQDERLAREVRTEFERSGLAHLLAVSGQNVMLLATLVFALGALGGVPLRGRLLGAMALVALYVPLAGAGPSIQRAGVMGAAGLVAALAGRPAARWYALGLAAAVTLALNPHAAGEPGWQLSFVAVVGLLALAPGLRAALVRRGWPEGVADAIAITLAATLATAPLLALHFGEVSLVSLPANLVAAPAVAPLMWLGMLAGALAQLDPALAAPLNALNAPLLGYLQWIAGAAAALPLASVPVEVPTPVALLLPYGLGLVAVLAARRAAGDERWSRGPGRGRELPTGARPALGALALGGVVALVIALRADRPPPPAPGELVVSFLDVGQGDATLLQRDGASILVDTGGPDGPVLERLAEARVGRLDLLVLTHAQLDHEGAALAVMREHRPRLVLNGGAGWSSGVQRALPAAARAAGARLLDVHGGHAVRVGAVRMRMLWPPAPPPGFRPTGDPNDRALVAHVQVGAFDLLLPADAESDVTAALDLPDVEALKVAHHGSADPGLPALLERLSPQFAAIEVGRGNDYGHPVPATLLALQGAVPVVKRTDRDGTVRLRVQGEALRVQSDGPE